MQNALLFQLHLRGGHAQADVLIGLFPDTSIPLKLKSDAWAVNDFCQVLWANIHLPVTSGMGDFYPERAVRISRELFGLRG